MSRAGDGVICNCDPSDHDYEQLARNCYPETIDKLEGEIARLRSALEKYGEHRSDCQLEDGADRYCTECITGRTRHYCTCGKVCTCGFSTAHQGGSDGK